MEKQNITLSLPKDVLLKIKKLAIDKNTSVSGLLTKYLQEIIEKEEQYQFAKRNAINKLNKGFNLGINNISWQRDELYER